LQIARIARERGALTIADAVTSLGAHPLDVAAWNVDACYSCTQKGLGAPSGLALLEDYCLRRKYHHTISARLVYALAEALCLVEEEGLEVRWARHDRHHRALAAALEAMGLTLLPPPGERLWTLNAVCVPSGVDEAAVRRHLLEHSAIEIGVGLGPLAGRIWRVGLMGSGSTEAVLLQFLGAFESALLANSFRLQAGAGIQAAVHLLH
jgi:alanine-glyoxylate transaminase / serine-glyoxylate transaminase / serine-pyruvate transaminase